jgi:HlyD family secretion protein
VIDKFTIYAPSSGMLIYYKEWGGTKRKVGSNISPWDLTVATLPDLSSMISKTYVNEIDISKIKVGQEVRIGVDAFPEKKYTGRVLEVANVGEQLPNTDAKVYEVIIKLDGSDPILRPAMTSSNQIVTAVYKDTLSVPLEAIHVDDSIPYVVKKKGTKQIVVLGESNENQIIIEQGLKTGDAVLLSLPDDVDKMKVEGQELVSVILEKERQKKREEERKKAEAEQEAAQRQFAMPQGMAPEQMQRAMQGSDGQRVMIQSSDTGRIRRFQNLTPEQVQRMRSGGNRKPQQLKADTVKISK